jgi:hypothetical protein
MSEFKVITTTDSFTMNDINSWKLEAMERAKQAVRDTIVAGSVCDVICERIDRAIRSVHPSVPGDWIPVKAGMLPQGGGRVLVCSGTGFIGIELAQHIRYLHECGVQEGDGCYFLYWMPIPAVPGAGEKEKMK